MDTICDLDTPRSLWPWIADASVNEIAASCLLEHLPHWENLVLECARVLRPSGLLRVKVPYRFEYRVLGPYHVRFFDEYTFDPFRADYLARQSDLRKRPHAWRSLEFSAPYFTLEDQWVEHLYPFAWHLATHIFGNLAYKLPLGPRVNLNVVLRRVKL